MSGTTGCSRSCEVPDGVTLTPVPAPRHAWSDVIVCPYEDCGAAFLVFRDDKTAALSGETTT